MYWIGILFLLCSVGAVWYLLRPRSKPRVQVTLKPSYWSIISMEMDIYGFTHYSRDGEYVEPYVAVLVDYGPGGEQWVKSEPRLTSNGSTLWSEREELRQDCLKQQELARRRLAKQRAERFH